MQQRTNVIKPLSSPQEQHMNIQTIRRKSQRERISSKAMASSPLPFSMKVSPYCLCITMLVASVSILFLAESTYSNQIQQEKEMSSLTKGFVSPSSSSSSNQEETENSTEVMIESHEVQMELPFGSGSDKKTLSYYHCGETISASSYSPKDNEIILLHGAKFTKENWVESNILQHLCFKGNDDIANHGRMSITALDLSVRADGLGLKSAFDSLVEKGVLSGKPAVVVTPSASGRSIVSMITSQHPPGGQEKESLLEEIVKVWMPVASFAVMSVKNDDVFKAFRESNIPILAMNGDADAKGKDVTAKLVGVANAKGVEMKGGHPCYLDSPTKFEDTIISFLRDL